MCLKGLDTDIAHQHCRNGAITPFLVQFKGADTTQYIWKFFDYN